jgi:hypothetical protein
MHHSNAKIFSEWILSRIIFILALISLNLILPATVSAFPLEENFEGETSAFDIPADSGWGIAEAQGAWTAFNGSRHLENHAGDPDPSRKHHRDKDPGAILGEGVLIPQDSVKPALSFWYKSHLSKDNRVEVNIHYAEYRKKGKKRKKNSWENKVDKIKTYGPSHNTGEFHVWERLSLKKYRGKEIRVSFSQKTGRHREAVGVFTVDDLRISDLPTPDFDGDGIPDEYDPTPKAERLPAVDDFQAEPGDGVFVNLQWSPVENEPMLLGYRIFRRQEDETREVLINDGKLIGADETFFVDYNVRNAARYAYRIVALSKEGHPGEPAGDPVPVYIAYNLTEFPYEESFDHADPGFEIPPGSGWAVVKDHGQWSSFSGDRHLDSNPEEIPRYEDKASKEIVRAVMKKQVHIPADAKKPALSFWYRTNLERGDKVHVDIHYVSYGKHGRKHKGKGDWKKNAQAEEKGDKKHSKVKIDEEDDDLDDGAGPSEKKGQTREKVDQKVRTFKSKDNQAAYSWISIPLRKYRGTEIRVAFRQQLNKDGSASVFVVDDLRISEHPGVDADKNKIPDEYESPLNEDMLPFVEEFSAAATDKKSVNLSWSPIGDQPSLSCRIPRWRTEHHMNTPSSAYRMPGSRGIQALQPPCLSPITTRRSCPISV